MAVILFGALVEGTSLRDAVPILSVLAIVAVLLWRVATSGLDLMTDGVCVRNPLPPKRCFRWEEILSFGLTHGVIDRRTYLGIVETTAGSVKVYSILVNPVFERSVNEGESMIAELNEELRRRTGRRVERVQIPRDEIWFKGRLGRL
jgi:hypothetical protein